MIFLRENPLLEKELVFDDVKNRLLGHWGTCPGLILVYAHLNRLIQKHKTEMLFVVGPGHGAPAILACNWLEGSLEKYYPDKYPRNKEGLSNLITTFSLPTGFPSHINAGTPGAIHEGGELGYALSVSFGAVMDKPDLVIACVVGDGEAETGPTATAWHAYKYLDPKESGAVIPILHVNGFKISERTIFGCMDDKEITALFSGYGYQVRIVENLEKIDADLSASMEWALSEIKIIQKAARSGNPITKPRWPVIIMRTPKGWSGPRIVDGEFIEGSFRSHQIPLPKAKTDEGQLKQLKDWLFSYDPRTLFENGSPSATVLKTIPEDALKLGQSLDSIQKTPNLKIVDWKKYGVKQFESASSTHEAGVLLDQILQDNPHDVRIFSPDELESNKLDAVFDHTDRNFQWDQYSNKRGGRVIEILSEHTCQGFLQGYTLTGRVGLFPSYESFLGIIHTMMVQYAKFVKIAKETSWRRDIGSLNYMETSTWTRQEHNGYDFQSHDCANDIDSRINNLASYKPFSI
jgi:xylulose-5-phosphate/fructose-6-phosphate phosphoketolase